ncbi:cache domain-containing sensor histidine kinase [Paenibacillus aceris]|uniref:histidine kinase n=1 Tax=Paenibacillus aceris TaxID=869555 RepID=A0ABS4HWN7_9BACL|nr:sensor histidine kinase [Paenibacillus aceris]MBP1962915.1 two-component system sensor histidine kinase YesM [Paenibacillus aceris]
MLRRPVPIFIQLLAGMFLIAALAIALTNLLNYRMTSQIVLNRTASYTQESVEQLSAKIDVLLRQYDQVSQMVAFDEKVQAALKAAPPPQGVDIDASIGLNRYLAEKIRYIAGDMLLHLFDRNGHAYSSNESLQLFWRLADDVAAVSWYSKMEALDGHMLWVYGPAWRDGEIPAIIGARRLKDPSSLTPLGDEFVVFPVDKINRIIGETGQRIERKVQVMDSIGNIVYSTVPREIGTAADVGLFSKFGRNAQPFFEWKTREDQRQVLVTYAKSQYSGWTTIAYFKPEAVNSEASQIWAHALLTMGAGILIALVFVTYFTWTLTKPIRLLAEGMNRLRKEGVKPIAKPFASREITRLYANYNALVEELEEVVERLSEQQITAQWAQLVALKAQFRPHFLYNSLNLIYWTIEDERPEQAQAMTLALSELLRYSVHPSTDLVTLGEDLEQLDRYLLLQRARYGEKFQVNIEVEEGLEQQRVIRLVLQPLVENAFHHGLEQQSDGGWKVRVRIYRQDGMVLCSVEDNGVGMTQEGLQKLELAIHQEQGFEKQGRGIGLSNLHKQLQAFFGPNSGIRLSRSPLGGLQVMLSLPLQATEMMAVPPILSRKGGGGAA